MTWLGWLLTWAIPFVLLLLVLCVGHGEPKSPRE